jgi:hypothetical protein
MGDLDTGREDDLDRDKPAPGLGAGVHRYRPSIAESHRPSHVPLHYLSRGLGSDPAVVGRTDHSHLATHRGATVGRMGSRPERLVPQLSIRRRVSRPSAHTIRASSRGFVLPRQSARRPEISWICPASGAVTRRLPARARIETEPRQVAPPGLVRVQPLEAAACWQWTASSMELLGPVRATWLAPGATARGCRQGRPSRRWWCCRQLAD